MIASFYRKYNRSAARALDSGEAEFLAFLESLSIVDWEEFLAALLQRRADALEIVRAAYGEDPLAYAAQSIANIPATSQRLVSGAVNRLLRDLWFETQNEGQNNAAIASSARLLGFAARVSDEETIALLQTMVNDPSLTSSLRTEAANALANHAEQVPESYWLQIDVISCPSLAPAIVNGLNERAPALCLEVLGQLQAPSSREALEYPLRVVLLSLARRKRWLVELEHFKETAPSWLREMLDQALTMDEIANLVCLEEARENPPAELALHSRRKHLESYLAGQISDPPDMSSWSATLVASFWDDVLLAWNPDSQLQTYSARLLQLIPGELSPASLAKLILVFRRTGDATDAMFLMEESRHRIWERLERYGQRMLILSTSPLDYDRHLFELYLQAVRVALGDQLICYKALRLYLSLTLDRDLPLVMRLALSRPHISAERCWTILTEMHSAEIATATLSQVISNLAESTIGQRTSEWEFGPVLEGEARTIAVKLMQFAPDLFRGAEIGEAAFLDIEEAATPMTVIDSRREIWRTSRRARRLNSFPGISV